MITMLVINLYIYAHKTHGYIYDLSNYVSLYYPSEIPSISKIRNAEKDSVEIILNKGTEETDWEIIYTDKTDEVTAVFPTVYLPFNNNIINDFEIINKNSGFRFDIRMQRVEDGSILVLNSSIPYTNIDRYSFDFFCDISWISQDEQNAVSKLLHEVLKIDTCSSTLSRIEVISRHTNNATRQNADIGLNYWWNDYTAYELFQKCINGETNLTCNEYSEIYYLFANLAGIKTRRVGLIGHGESDGLVKLSGHHFNESYVEELNKWVFIDLSFNKEFVLNPKGTPMNTFELYMANVSGNTSNLQAAVLTGDSITFRPYDEVNNPEVDYFNGNCLIQYKRGNDRFNIINQLLRYILTPEPVLGLNYSNERLYLKNFMLFFLLLSIIAVIVSGIMFAKFKLGNRKKSKPLTR